MNAELNPENEQFLDAAVDGGQYENLTEALNEAVALLRKRDRLISDVNAGIREIREGQGIPVADDEDPHVSDLNEDGHPDLFCHYSVPETGIAMGDVEACLTGETSDGEMFEGCAPIRTIPEPGGSAASKANGRKR